MSDSTTDPQWEPCPDGEIRRMVDRAGSQRRLQQFTAVAGLLFVLLCSVGVVTAYLNARGGGTQNMACADVCEMLPDFVAGNLDADMQEQLQQHLDYCKPCREKYQVMLERQNNVTLNRTRADNRLAIAKVND